VPPVTSVLCRTRTTDGGCWSSHAIINLRHPAFLWLIAHFFLCCSGATTRAKVSCFAGHFIGGRRHATSAQTAATSQPGCTLFDELVNACSARHFVESDLSLLSRFVTATIIARDTAHDPNKIAMWERAVRMQATLVTRLRLSPQSRADPKTVGRHSERTRPLPWEK
jgi:hypothetical protein